MRMLYSKGRYSLVFMLILALVLQVVGLMVSEYVYAGEVQEESEEYVTDSYGDRLVETGTSINFLIVIGTIILLMGLVFIYDGKRI